jgi:hypothetical protein
LAVQARVPFCNRVALSGWRFVKVEEEGAGNIRWHLKVLFDLFADCCDVGP